MKVFDIAKLEVKSSAFPGALKGGLRIRPRTMASILMRTELNLGDIK
jgi:hypothetical protein